MQVQGPHGRLSLCSAFLIPIARRGGENSAYTRAPPTSPRGGVVLTGHLFRPDLPYLPYPSCPPLSSSCLYTLSPTHLRDRYTARLVSIFTPHKLRTMPPKTAPSPGRKSPRTASAPTLRRPPPQDSVLTTLLISAVVLLFSIIAPAMLMGYTLPELWRDILAWRPPTMNDVRYVIANMRGDLGRASKDPIKVAKDLFMGGMEGGGMRREL